MFKPSLRRTVLKQEMSTHQTKNKYSSFSISNQSSKNINGPTFVPFLKQNTNIPSMLIPEELLQNKKFSNNKNYTHTVSPLAYDFYPYPQIIKQMIKNHFKQVQIGVSQQIFYATYNQKLYLWREDKGPKIHVRQHKFNQKIGLIKVFTIKNPLLFKADQLNIVAISFQNRVELFSIDQKDLILTDLMIKYKISSASKINKMEYTLNSQLLICGNDGKVCMISFSSSKQLIVKIEKNPLQKYISKKSFDYYSQYITKQIAVFNNFVYCLTQKHMKTNIFLYSLKKFCSLFIGGKVQQMNRKTYIDIYKLNETRTAMKYVDRLDQKQIQEKIKSSYANYIGEQIQQPFKITSLIERSIQIQPKKQNNIKRMNTQKQNQSQEIMEEEDNNISEDEQSEEKVVSLIFTERLSFITRCGYSITIKHRNNPQAKDKEKAITKNLKKKIMHNFVFAQEPFKIFQNLQKIALVDTLQINRHLHQKESRRNFVLTSKGFNNLTIMSDKLIYFGGKSIGIIAAAGIKPIIFERSKKVTQKTECYYNEEETYCEIQNLQRQWIVFNNEGHQKVYLLEPRHLLLSYLYFKQETNYQLGGQKKQRSLFADKVLDFDDNFHKIIQKLIKIFGYYQFNKIIIQLLLNSNQIRNNQAPKKTERIYLQRQIIQNLIHLEVKEQKYRAFEDWFYELSTYKAQKIEQTQRISLYLWTLLMEYQFQPILNTQFEEGQKQIKTYANFYEQFQRNSTYNIRYSSYGYALKTIFFNIIEPIINLKAKEYKQKYLQIKSIQEKLKDLLSFLQQKHLKEQNNRYKTCSNKKNDRFYDQKVRQIQKKQNKQNISKNLGNDSISTNYTNQSLIINLNQVDEMQTNSQNQVYIEKSISEVQNKIQNSTKKILILIQVFSKLIQRDERAKKGEELPTFGEVMTNFKNQIIIGEAFFNQQCAIIFQQQNIENRGIIATIINSQLMKDIQLYLPQLGIQEKIQYINFKKAKNILWLFQKNTSLDILVDLKSLDIESLAQITNSSHLYQMRLLFIGRKDITKLNDLSSQDRLQRYLQFIIINLRKIIQKLDYLSNIQRTFDQKSKSKKPYYLKAMTQNLKRENQIVITQQSQYLQKEIQLFYEQLKTLFIAILIKFNEATGKQYYITEKTLEFAIELIVRNCYFDQSIMQFLQHGLKQYKLIEKVIRMKKLQEKIKTNSSTQLQKVIVKQNSLQLDEVKELIKQNQLSTMEMYLKMSKKTGNTQQTNDTSRRDSLMSRTQMDIQKK